MFRNLLDQSSCLVEIIGCFYITAGSCFGYFLSLTTFSKGIGVLCNSCSVPVNFFLQDKTVKIIITFSFSSFCATKKAVMVLTFHATFFVFIIKLMCGETWKFHVFNKLNCPNPLTTVWSSSLHPPKPYVLSCLATFLYSFYWNAHLPHKLYCLSKSDCDHISDMTAVTLPFSFDSMGMVPDDSLWLIWTDDVLMYISHCGYIWKNTGNPSCLSPYHEP